MSYVSTKAATATTKARIILVCPNDGGTDVNSYKDTTLTKLNLDKFTVPWYLPTLANLNLNLGYVWTD